MKISTPNVEPVGFEWNVWPFGILKSAKCVIPLLILVTNLTWGVIAYASEEYNILEQEGKVGGLNGYCGIGFVTLCAVIFFIPAAVSMGLYVYGMNRILSLAFTDMIESAVAGFFYLIASLIGLYALINSLQGWTFTLIVYCLIMSLYAITLTVVNVYFVYLLFKAGGQSLGTIIRLVINGYGVVSFDAGVIILQPESSGEKRSGGGANWESGSAPA